MKLHALIAAIIVPSAAGSHAAILFADTFDRTDTGVYNDNSTNGALDATLTGITDGTGSSLTAGNVYSRPFTTGGAGILNNGLLLASGAGTSNAYINHNFTNSSITTAGGFSVTIDLTAVNQSSIGQGGGFTIGMSQAEADSAGDAIAGDPKMTNAFGDTGKQAVSDFWLVLRADASLAWGGIGANNVFGTTSVAAKTGTISAEFSFTDFNASSTVNYEIFYNGTSESTGSFTWSGTNENYIGIDARDNQGVTFDNLAIQTIPEPGSILLGTLGLLGLLRRRR